MRSSFILLQMLRRRRDAEAQASREAEGGEEADAGIREREHSAGSVHRGVADGRGVGKKTAATAQSLASISLSSSVD